MLLSVALGGRVGDPGGNQQRQRPSGEVPEGLFAVAQGVCGVLQRLLDLPPAFEEIAAEPTELVFDRTELAPAWLNVVGLQGGALLLDGEEALTQPTQLLFGLEELGAGTIVETLGALAPLVDADVLVELLDEVEAEEVLYGRSYEGGGLVGRGVPLDLFTVEEEQVGDVVGQQVVDLGHPVVDQGGGEAVVLEDTKLFAALAARVLAPSAAQRVAILGAVSGVTEGELNGGAPVGGLVVDAAGEIIGVAETPAARCLGAGAKEDELERVEEGGLAAAVETAEQHYGLVGCRWG